MPMPWKYLDHKLLCCPSHSFYPTFLNIHLYYSVRFCLLRAFVSAQGSGAPQKRGGFVTKRILKKLNLWGRLVVKTVKKFRNHGKKGCKNCPPHVIASPGFSVSTHNLLIILRSDDIWICVTRAPLLYLKSKVVLYIFQSLSVSE